MKQHAHMITISPWGGLSFGERLALETATALLWPLQSDQRLTVLINLMSAQIIDMAATEDEVDAIVDLLRVQLKLSAAESPPQRH